MYENKKINGVHASRYIASWLNGCGSTSCFKFRDWLQSLGLEDDDVRYLVNLFINGKLELEKNAEKYKIEHNIRV